MTTLVLGLAGAAIGNMVGGPLGASIGFNLGAALGSALDPPKVEGPRINDLKLQTSSYGTPIPIIYGAFRLGGSVIWQTKLQEHKETSGGKGGGPEVTTYTYSASFAILICEGPVIAIRRIWADGRVIRDGLELGLDLPLTIYLGDETQTADPTMEADKGAGEVPAHRGSVYVVFTDLYVTEFGNRIPNLEFEIVTSDNGVANCPLVIEAGDTLSTYPLTGGGGWAANGTSSSELPPVITSITIPTEGEPQTEPTVAALPLIDLYDGDQYVWAQSSSMFADPDAHWTFSFYRGPMHIIGDTSNQIWVNTTSPISALDANPSIGWGARPFLTINKSGCNNGQPSLDVGQWQGVANFLGPRNSYIALWDNFPHSAGGSACLASVPQVGQNIALTAGLPVGQYIQFTSGSFDNQRLFVFTGAAANATATAWYEIVNGVTVNSGTVSPPLARLGIGYGPFVQYSYISYEANQFENNGRYMWSAYGAGTAAGAIRCYWIDNAGNFAQICSDAGMSPTPAHLFWSPAVAAYDNGKFMVVAHKIWQVFTRGGSDGDLSTTPVTLSSIVADLSDRSGLVGAQYDVTELTDLVTGYAVTQRMDTRSAVQTLMPPYFFDGVESDGVVKFPKRGRASIITIPDDDLAAHDYGGDLPPLAEIARTQEVELPRQVSIAYINQATDYQPGLQMAARQTGSAVRDAAYQSAIVMDDDYAKRVADALLYGAWIERDRYRVFLSRKYAKLDPTDVITAKNRRLRLTKRVDGADGVLVYDALADSGAIWTQAAPAGDSGGGFIPPDPIVVRVTDLVLMDVPLVTDTVPPFGLYVGMADNASTSWPGATLFVSVDSGVTYTELTASVTASTFGVSHSILGDFTGGNIFDETNSVSVELSAGSGTLSSASTELVLNGSNTAALGSEIIQYKTATPTGTRMYLLSGLLRGRFGTEWATGTHITEERFLVLPSTTAPMGFNDLGRSYIYKAVTSGSTLAAATPVTFTDTGVSARPYAPVLLGGGRNAAADIILTWVRRAIRAAGWVDNSDIPDMPGGYRFRINVYSDNTYATLLMTTDAAYAVGASLEYPLVAAMQTALFGSTQATLYWGVQEVGGAVIGKEARGST
jgi:hypothetical protein